MLSRSISHVGVAVPDLEAAMVELGTALALNWASVQTLDIDGTEVRLTYSLEGPPHLELIEGAPGGIWDARSGGRQHHVGYWSDDLAGDRDRLAGAGLRVVFETRGAVYQQATSGLCVELVDARVKPALQRWFSGGNFL